MLDRSELGRDEIVGKTHVSPFSTWMVRIGLLCVLFLFGVEFVHYGLKSRLLLHDLAIDLPISDHPTCRQEGANPRELICTIGAYNTARVHCLNERCSFRDQDAQDVTPEYRQKVTKEQDEEREESRKLTDKIAAYQARR